jgi:hypothetical protein
MNPQPIDFLEWWVRLNLALDDAGLPEIGFLTAMVIHRSAVINGDDLDQVIRTEVRNARAVAKATEATS